MSSIDEAIKLVVESKEKLDLYALADHLKKNYKVVLDSSGSIGGSLKVFIGNRPAASIGQNGSVRKSGSPDANWLSGLKSAVSSFKTQG